MALAPFVLTGHALLERYAALMPVEYQGYAAAAVGLLALLAGKVTPEPLKLVPSGGVPVRNPDGSVTVQIGAECSTLDRIRGLC